MKRQKLTTKQLSNEYTKSAMCKFTTNKFIHGITINLIDNNPYSKLMIDIWFDNLYTGSYEVPHLANIDDDCFGSSTSIFRTKITPVKTSGIIKIVVKTKLLYYNKITMNLIVSDSETGLETEF